MASIGSAVCNSTQSLSPTYLAFSSPTPHTQPFPGGNDFNDVMTKFLFMWKSTRVFVLFYFVLFCFSSGSGDEAHYLRTA